MDVLRTPEERSRDLPDVPYEPRYVEVDDGEEGTLRVAYVDEGPPDSGTVLLLHGEPTWSLPYREHVTLPGGGHVFQEDVGPRLARVVVELVAAIPGA